MASKKAVTRSRTPVVANLPVEQVAAKLRAMGDAKTADKMLAQAGPRGLGLPFGGPPKPWQYATHEYGYIAPRVAASTEPLPIQYAGAIDPDKTLEGGCIDIRLDRLRIQEYPGSGVHEVMINFTAENHVGKDMESVSFHQTYRASQGHMAGVVGYPVFLGLHVGGIGAAFNCFTVNVKSEGDQEIIKLLKSSPFQSGLSLLETAQPVLKPFTELGLGLAEMFAGRNTGAKVQDFYMGLDFQPMATGVPLREGSYIAVQVPKVPTIKWDEWVFSMVSGAIVNKADDQETIPYNYIVFRVTRHRV